MTSLLDPLTEEETSSETKDVIHIVRCDDENLSLCGVDISDHEWVGDDIEPTCPVCNQLWYERYCPVLKTYNIICECDRRGLPRHQN